MKMQVLSERIKRFRKSKGFTQAELAEILNLSEMTIRRWESGRVSPRLEELQSVATLFGTSTAYLSGETDDPTPGVILIPKGLMNSTINVGDRNSISNNTSPALKSFLPIPPMSYWGEVVDNARNLAKKGSPDDILGVSQMLKIALRLLEPALQIGEGATA